MIKILKPGVLDTFQDSGRFGFSKWGVNTNGSMDQFASAVANALVGNSQNAAVIEMHFPAPRILFLSDALISLTGADFSATVNGRKAPVWKSVVVPAQSVLEFTKKIKGARGYLAIHGGFDLPLWLGSASTNLKSKTGGLEGRCLKTGDLIGLKTANFRNIEADGLKIFPWSVNVSHVYDENTFSILPGREWNWMDERAANMITSTSFAIDASSDRMASLLTHTPIQFVKHEQLLSSAVTRGTIQALPSGKLCVLMADHQTTGGYPRIGHVISAHLPKFSQLNPGESFSFSKTNLEQAEKMLLSLHESVSALRKNLLHKLNSHYGIN